VISNQSISKSVNLCSISSDATARATMDATVNPLKGSGVIWLHFEVFSAIKV